MPSEQETHVKIDYRAVRVDGWRHDAPAHEARDEAPQHLW